MTVFWFLCAWSGLGNPWQCKVWGGILTVECMSCCFGLKVCCFVGFCCLRLAWSVTSIKQTQKPVNELGICEPFPFQIFLFLVWYFDDKFMVLNDNLKLRSLLLAVVVRNCKSLKHPKVAEHVQLACTSIFSSLIDLQWLVSCLLCYVLEFNGLGLHNLMIWFEMTWVASVVMV